MTLKNAKIGLFLVVGTLFFSTIGWTATAKNGLKPKNSDVETLAVIAGKPITLAAFKAEMTRRSGEYDAARRKELLDNLVRSELLFAAAKTAGYENDPEVIAAIKQLLVGKYLRDNLEPKLAGLKATDQEAESYYQAHQADFGTPAMVHGAIIKIAVSPKYSEETKAELFKRAENARAEALVLEPGVAAFGAVAVKYSDDQDSRYRGGDIDWLPVGEVDGRRDKKVSEALAALKAPGQVSPVITAADGYYIVKLMETKGATVKPFAAVKDGVRYLIIQEKKQQLEQEFIEQLKKKIPVTVNSSLLQTIPLVAEDKKAGPAPLPKR